MKLSNRVALLAGMGSFLDGYDLIVIAGALAFVEKSLNLSSKLGGLAVGMSFLGGFFGALFLSRTVDLYGRRIVFLYDLLLFIVGTLIAALSVNFIMLFVGRFLVGMAIGVDLSVTWTMVSEFAPNLHRGALLSLQFILWDIGAILSYFFLIALLPVGNPVWRYVFLIGLIPAIIVTTIRRTIPESPRWLLSKQRKNEAMEIITSNNLNISSEAIQKELAQKRVPWTNLFSRNYRRNAIGVFVIQTLAFLALVPFNLFTPEVLKLIGFSGSEAIILLGSAFVWTFSLIAWIAAFFALDSIGRKLVAGVSYGIAVVFLAVLVLAYGDLPTNVFFGMWVTVEFFATFGSASLWAWSNELFPTSLRGFAQGFNASGNRIAGFFGSYLTAALLAISLASLYSVSLAATIVVVAVILLLKNSETKRKDLSDIYSG